MSGLIWLVGLATLVIALLLTYAMRRISFARGLMDIPNERSSHAVPTPRGGGVAIVIASLCAFCALGAVGLIDWHLLAALVGGGLAVAVVGLIDDRRPLPASTRLPVHLGAALWAVVWLGGPPRLFATGPEPLITLVCWILTVLAIVWMLNLYNFMDGIDGIAASEALFVSWGGALLLLLAGHAVDVVSLAVVFGAACAGFLYWNWPPARIFMGDVGSGYIGYAIAVLALAACREVATSLQAWLILSGLFFVDATVTLLRRLFRGERVHSPHRSHAYQWLARRWGGHKPVTVTFLLVNLLWLLPWALFVTLRPAWLLTGVALALGPLIAVVLVAGAGRPESPRGA